MTSAGVPPVEWQRAFVDLRSAHVWLISRLEAGERRTARVLTVPRYRWSC
jgi:hypothetical protein